MAEITTYNDYVDLANQEYNLTLQGATEDNLFSKISESGQRSQLARYYYNKTGFEINASNRIVIAPKNGYMIQRLSYISNDLIGGVKSGIQVLDIDTTNEGEIVLRNKGSIGQVELLYVLHSLAYALGIRVDMNKVDIYSVLNDALHDFEFLYFAPLNIARTITPDNIHYIDVVFIVYNNRTYFDKELLQSLANSMYKYGWFTQTYITINDLSQIEFDKAYYYKDNIYANIDIDYLKHLIHEFLFGSSNVGNDLKPYLPQLYNAMVEKLIVAIEGLDASIKNGNHPYWFQISEDYSISDYDYKPTITMGFGVPRDNNESYYVFPNNQKYNDLYEGNIYFNKNGVYNKFSFVGVIKLNPTTHEFQFVSVGNVTYLSDRTECFAGYKSLYKYLDEHPLLKTVYSNIGSHIEKRGVEGITIVDPEALPTGIDSFDSDYPYWVEFLYKGTVTSLQHLEGKVRNALRIIDFLPLNIITNGLLYPDKDYTPIEVTTYEVLLPEIIPPQRPNTVLKTLTLIPDEDDTVEDPEDPKTYEPIIDPNKPENYPPTNKYYYDIDVEINYPKDFIDPIGGTNGNPTNPIEPPNKNEGNISIPPKNPTDSVTSSKLFTVYNPTADQIDALGGYLWGESIAGTLASIFTNPLNAIISLHCIYCEPDVIGTKEIRLGYLASGVSAKYVVSQYKEVDCGTIRIPEYYGDCRDYSPYTSINLFLPFIGFRPIKVDDVMGSELSIKYFVDVYTGTCLACVSVNKGGVIQLTYTFDGNCAVMLPLTAGSWANMTVGLATALTSMIVNPVAGALQLPNAVHNGISMSSQGQLGCNAGAMGRKKPYVVVTNTQAYDAVGYNELYGYPANILTKLSQLEGYTKVKEVHVENVNNATVDEKNEIERLLKSGVIIS